MEEAEVPRSAFGQTKSFTSSEWRLYPYTRDLRHDFADYVNAHGGSATPIPLKRLQSIAQRYLGSVEYRWPGLARHLPDIGPDVPNLQFQWAVDRLLADVR